MAATSGMAMYMDRFFISLAQLAILPAAAPARKLLFEIFQKLYGWINRQQHSNAAICLLTLL